jgi:hypothetical protein
MQIKFIASATVAMAFVFSTVPALAEPVGRWWSGWGMGVTEYGFKKDDANYIHISCDPHRKTYVAVSISGRNPRAGSAVVFLVNGQTLRWLADRQGYLPTESHVDSSNYYSLLEEVRRGSGALRISYDGRTTTFPLKGSARELPSDPCPSDFGKS